MPPGPTGPNGATAARARPVGRITGTSVGELRFRVGPDEPVHLGEILLADANLSTEPTEGTELAGPASSAPSVDGPRRSPPFYLRVTDLEYGADARDGDWEERTAGALMSAGGEDLVLHDREDRL